MSVIKFDVNKLNSIIETAKQASGNSGGSDGPRTEWTRIGYLQNGKHKCRFFSDPKGELFRMVAFHQTSGRKCLCPDFENKRNARNPNWPTFVQSLCPEFKEQGLTELPKCEICEAADEIDYFGSGLPLKFRHMIYAYLYDTDAADEKFWKPGTPYVFLGKKKMKDAIVSFIEGMVADASDYVISMLNPTVSGGFVSMTVTGGQGGSVAVSAIPGVTKDPIFAEGQNPEWWRPLDDPNGNVFISPTFNIDHYWDFVDEVVKAKLKDHRDKIERGEKTDAELQAEKDAEEAGEDRAVSDSNTQAATTQSSPPGVTTQPVETPTVQEPVQQTDMLAGLTPEQRAKLEANAGPKVEEPASDLLPNQRRLKNGGVIDLNEDVVKLNCWTQYNPSNTMCIRCEHNMACMTEALN